MRQFDALMRRAEASKTSATEIVHTLKSRGLWDAEMWTFPWDSVVRYYALAVDDMRVEKKALDDMIKKRRRRRPR